jgi:hypothetical protein
MLGKAVKIRHCPATVSAPDSAIVESGNGKSEDAQPLEQGSGKVTEKAQVRRPVLDA